MNHYSAEMMETVRARVESIALPDGYAWGPWLGTYRVIERDGQEICRVGGVAALCGEIGAGYQIALGERLIAKHGSAR